MPATLEARLRTRTFARVFGPFLTIVPTVVLFRMRAMGVLVSSFFGNPAVVWMMGALVLMSGLLIIAFHQYWHSVSAVLLSLLGWFFALRGLALLAAPELYSKSAAAFSTGNMTRVAYAFPAFMLSIGIWFTYTGWIAKPPAHP